MKLRPVRPADAERLTSWLPDVAADTAWAEWAEPDSLARAVHEPNVLTDESCAVFLAFELESPNQHAALVDVLAVSPEQRRLGIGGRAVLALERHLRGKANCVYARVPASIGLALYFWLRLGYRPLTKKEWPVSPKSAGPAVWMMRNL